MAQQPVHVALCRLQDLRRRGPHRRPGLSIGNGNRLGGCSIAKINENVDIGAVGTVGVGRIRDHNVNRCGVAFVNDIFDDAGCDHQFVFDAAEPTAGIDNKLRELPDRHAVKGDRSRRREAKPVGIAVGGNIHMPGDNAAACGDVDITVEHTHVGKVYRTQGVYLQISLAQYVGAQLLDAGSQTEAVVRGDIECLTADEGCRATEYSVGGKGNV